MKMTIESYGKKMSIETDNDDVGITEYIDMVNIFLLGVGFHQETINNGFKEFIEEKEL
jgi:gamma-glutamyl-gamma-aminobutyrate hydrolase PuuD